MNSRVPPHMQAYVDQHAARLRDLVEQARQHRAFGCDVPLPCPGEDVVRELAGLDCHQRFALLLMAVAELAALGYGAPVDGLEVTDAGRAALDVDDTRPGHPRDDADEDQL